MSDEKKCPRCGNDCWRDEHPDGYYVGLWGCTMCEWSEPKIVDNEPLIDKEPLV